VTSNNQGAWTLGCCGNPDIRTPAIDRLAREGMRFARAFSVNAVCSPTRASFLTDEEGGRRRAGERGADGQARPQRRCEGVPRQGEASCHVQSDEGEEAPAGAQGGQEDEARGNGPQDAPDGVRCIDLPDPAPDGRVSLQACCRGDGKCDSHEKRGDEKDDERIEEADEDLARAGARPQGLRERGIDGIEIGEERN
jgi:hypothetical protein